MKCRFQAGMLEIMSVSSRYLPHVRRAKARYIEVSCCGKVSLHQVKRVKLIKIFLFRSLKSGQFLSQWLMEHIFHVEVSV